MGSALEVNPSLLAGMSWGERRGGAMQKLGPEKDVLLFFGLFVINWKTTVLGLGEKRRMEGVEHPALIGY